MPLGWTRSDEFGILTVVGQGDVGRRDIEDYLNATVREGTKAHAKLVDVTASNLNLDRDDLESVARTLLEYGIGGGAGPVALVVHGALNIDMAVLLKQRVGPRPFRIFTDPLDARGWLMTLVRPLPPDPTPR
ncbi:MAG: hypothetical protein EPO10_07735 [Reyranella sp.]|uniref:hypothetical protein n=1 Tax=Reyranella sp. TaxID=1929291 RepID=UPI0012036F39|nr:hypothetical protein [Reyranella sp.]TAJ87919.1 MAG: hypothetical protein EPO41_22660 [Reyranella sp.]TBR29478.1 MAG: hypothetical protein EPO10_07735 [Reyranella sp.]